MTTLLVTHPKGLEHLTGPGHPERPERLRAINQVLAGETFLPLLRADAPEASREMLLHAHPEAHVAFLEEARPTAGSVRVDADTVMSPGSWDAAVLAVGGACHAVDQVMGGHVRNAFSALRPPGHHAEMRRAMGFCLFNSVAVAARHAMREHGAERVAIFDFDVHHGNGTQDIFYEEPDVLYASTHQMPLYPGTGKAAETGVGNILNLPLDPGDDGVKFREAVEQAVLPAIEAFSPDFILLSAGFDAHWRDPLANLNFKESDFAWVTRTVMDLADRRCGGRVVSVLEGGYDLEGLAASTAAHVETLMNH